MSPVWNSDVDLGIESEESSKGASSEEEHGEHDVESFCAVRLRASFVQPALARLFEREIML